MRTRKSKTPTGILVATAEAIGSTLGKLAFKTGIATAAVQSKPKRKNSPTLRRTSRKNHVAAASKTSARAPTRRAG